MIVTVDEQPIRILLIDDNPDDRALVLRELRRSFGQAGVVEITNGTQLAGALSGPTAHLVITDYALGWTDGLTVLRQVKQRWPTTPVLMYTGTGNEEVAVEGMKLGLDDYIVKSTQHVKRLGSSVERALRHVDDLHELAAVTERYQALFDRVPVGLYRYDPGGTLIECNQALLDIFMAPDVKRLREAGFPRRLYVDEADRDRWRAAIATDGRASGVEYRVMRLSGEVAWVRHSAGLVRGERGEPMWFEGVIEDVTKSREAQEAVIEAEARFRALVENSSDFIMVLGPDGTMNYVSPSIAADLGHDSKELVGASVLDLIHPDDVDEIRRLIGRLAEEHGRALLLAARFRRNHDQWRAWEGVVTNRLQEPSIAGLILNAHDISGRLKAEAEAREAEHRYQSVFHNVPIGVYRSTPEGKHIDVNPAMVQILGFDTVQDYLDSNAQDLYVDPDERRRWQEIVDRDGVVRGFEERLRRPDGRVIWVRDSATAVRDESGKTIIYDGNIEDVTDRKEAERELQARGRQQLAVATLGRAGLADGPLSAMLDLACRLGTETIDVGFASFLELLPDEECFVIRASTGWPQEVIGVRKVPVAGSPPGLVLQSREPLVVEDVRDDPRFDPPERLAEVGIISAVWVPIQARDRVFGVFAVNSLDRRTFSDDEVTFLDAMASVLGEVIRRKETEDHLRKTLRQLHHLSDERQRLLSRLIAAQEEERQRLAGDIHDDPIQVMAAAAVRLDMVERAAFGSEAQETLERTAETVQQAINRLRHLVFELRPPALDREGLGAAIRQYLEQLSESEEIEVKLKDDLEDEPPKEIRTAAYRIVQEALTNVRKHAGATRVLVELSRRDGGISAVVKDDGVGFRSDGGISPLRPGHIGLQSMRERAEALGGWWRIESRPQAGTTMEFWLPDGVLMTGPNDD